MADYYPLITKAVARLDSDAPDASRRAIYERARAALLAQMRTTDPPFAETEIMREQLALEEAVRRVEREARQRAPCARVPTFSDLVTDVDDLGKVPPMFVTGGATGRLKGVWRCSMRFR